MLSSCLQAIHMLPSPFCVVPLAVMVQSHNRHLDVMLPLMDAGAAKGCTYISVQYFICLYHCIVIYTIISMSDQNAHEDITSTRSLLYCTHTLIMAIIM